MVERGQYKAPEYPISSARLGYVNMFYDCSTNDGVPRMRDAEDSGDLDPPNFLKTPGDVSSRSLCSDMFSCPMDSPCLVCGECLLKEFYGPINL